MRVLPAMLLVLLAVIHHSACEDSRRGVAWTRLGRELLIRAKLAGIIGTGSDTEADDSESSEENREHMIKADAAEDIFVGSQNDVSPQSSTDSSASKETTDEGAGNDSKQNEHDDTDGEKSREEADEEDEDSAKSAEDKDKNYDSSGDAGEAGESDGDNDDEEDEEKNNTDNEKSNEDDEDEKEDSEKSAGDDEDENEDETEDETEDEKQTDGDENIDDKNSEDESIEKEANDKFAQQLLNESGEDENADRRTIETSGSGSGSDVQTNEHDEADSSGSGQEAVEERANVAHSEETSGSGSEPSNGTSIMATATGSGQEISQQVAASKRSKIKSSSEENAEDDVNSAAIRKGVESLSRLLSPVASNYAFTLYSGSAMATDEDEKESEGEDESGQETADLPEVKVKQCKQVCELPMTFHECAVPRCDLKIGSIRDLCFWLCKHQKEVCRQECE